MKSRLTQNYAIIITTLPTQSLCMTDLVKMIIRVYTVGKIYTPIFSILRKRVVNITILELGPVSNESPALVILH